MAANTAPDCTQSTPILMSHDRSQSGLRCSDSEGDPLSYELTHGQHGTTAEDFFGGFRYTPDPGWTGTDTFWVTAFDGLVTSGFPQLWTVTVSNSAPTC